ncbi:MAG: hypothetical protein GZ086_00955 [Gelidibacter sp.]|nr:hypothetical protein [Gelidibacter sp.]
MVQEVVKPVITSLKTSIPKGEVISPIKSKPVTSFIKTKSINKPNIGLNKGVERIKTINSNLKGRIHQETGIKFQTKEVITGEGKIVSGEFPNFNKVSVQNTTLPKELIKAPTKLDIRNQNKFCTNTLKTKLDKNPEHYLKQFREANDQLIKDGKNYFHNKELNMEQMLEKQKNDISNPTSAEGGNVFGFSWHHHEKMGKMQLVPNGVHDKVRHTGGYDIWSK